MFSLDDYFHKGFTTLDIEPTMYNQFLSMMEEEDYTLEVANDKVENIFSPCWDGPIAHRTSDYYLNCTRYNDLLSSLIQSRKEFTFWK